jgi:hypothetical protein
MSPSQIDAVVNCQHARPTCKTNPQATWNLFKNMKKHLILLPFALSIMAAEGRAQFLRTSGTVRSISDSGAIAYAHVYVKNSNIGTYTNNHGQFEFFFPDSLANDTLVISHIGSVSRLLALASIEPTKRDSLKIFLEENAISLAEIIISDNPDSIETILRKVRRHRRKNYPNQQHYLEGFYRELSMAGDTYTRLIEASVGITQGSYMNDNSRTMVHIRQLRKSEDYRTYGKKERMFEWTMKKISRTLFGIEFDNNIYEMLDAGYPKWHGDDRNFPKKYDFEIIEAFENGTSTCYRIRFLPKPDNPANAKFFFGGEMVVNIDDFAVMDWKYVVNYSLTRQPPGQSLNFELQESTSRIQHVVYSKLEGRYYPTLIEIIEPSGNGTVMVDVPKVGTKHFQYDKVTLMVNKVATSRKEFDRIKKRDALDNEIDLYEADYRYDSTFWNNYNILLMDPLLKLAQEDLEKEKTLSDQFEEHGQ